MQVFSNRLRQEAKALGLPDAEVARRAGLSERRYGNYVSGIREPDLATLVKIATVLSTTPNRLLGVEDAPRRMDAKARQIARILSAVEALSPEDLERLAVQIEALARHRPERPRRKATVG